MTTEKQLNTDAMQAQQVKDLQALQSPLHAYMWKMKTSGKVWMDITLVDYHEYTEYIRIASVGNGTYVYGHFGRHINKVRHSIKRDLEPKTLDEIVQAVEDTARDVFKRDIEKMIETRFEGAEVLEITGHKVMAYMPNEFQQYATWRHDGKSYFWGHYFNDYDKAYEDYKER